MNWETVAIPFATGIKPVMRARVLEQGALQTAQNCFFFQDEGPQKRYGHTSKTILNPNEVLALDGLELPTAPLPRDNYSLENPELSSYWLHGFGLIKPNDESTSDETSPYRNYGYSFGQFARDEEIVFWDGFRGASYPTEGAPFAEAAGRAVMPSAKVFPIAKTLNGQTYPDGADNGVVRTVAWINDNTAYYSVFDSTSSAPQVIEREITSTTPVFLRVFCLGAWTHILVNDTGDNQLKLRSFHQDTPSAVIERDMGAATVDCFDVRKISETSAVMARIDTNAIKVTLINAEGNTTGVYTPTISSAAALVSIAPNHRGYLGILWVTTAGDANPKRAKFRSYVLGSGVVVSAVTTILDLQNYSRCTLADNYLLSSNASNVWTAYIENAPASGTYQKVHSYSIRAEAASASLIETRLNTVLASHAVRVGERTYVWCSGTPTLFELQPAWFLCDDTLKPIGKILFGLAYFADPTATFNLPSFNYQTTDFNHPVKDRFVFTGALGYRQRVSTADSTGIPDGVYQEPSIAFWKLDFLPKLRAAQAGRTTYIAGAQLWAYDGASFAESGFHMAPENVSGTAGAGGNLSASKTYRYRVELCAKNAQNEEIRSWSQVTSAILTTGVNKKITLTIPHMPMTRRDAYFLVFRTEGDGTVYYLTSSRNPADSSLTDNPFLVNDFASSTFSFIDNLSDSDLLTREQHPANADNFLQPLPAPACELVTAGNDRLWLAGGELSSGEIAPSRYFAPGQAPTFSPALNIQIDRNAEPITAIGFVGQSAVFFRRTSAYTLESEGPDNTGLGVWGAARLALADVGAVSQEGLALAGEGLYFQSLAGMRVITQGGGLRPPGAGLIGGLGTDVDTLVADGDYAAAVVFPKYSQIRWYSRDSEKPTIVVDYTKNVWTTWTGLECTGASYWFPADTVVVGRGSGEAWREVEGRYYDADRTYETVIKTAWLHGKSLGDFQRVRRWMLFGEADTGLTLRYRLFYDERPFHYEEAEIAFNGDLNDSTWGGGTWGQGSWGDAENPTGESGLWFRDNVFRIRKRAARQKCSVFAIEFSDQGSASNFAPVVLGLELGSKQGLDRIP